MSDTKRCPQCQGEIPAAATEGLCPQCLLQAGLQPKTAEAEAHTAPFSPSGSRFEPPTPEALQRAFPQLEILELLGKGGMGAVYKARQPGLDRLVAVKILPPEVSDDPAFAERFTREARALAMLNHPNIVGIHDSGRAGGYYYFVMEYMDGVNLRQAMRAGELTAAEALKIVPQICEALQFAHDEGIVHRDIKPENILLDRRGRVKIADFGLAKLLGKTAPDVSLTGTQQVMGTMHYMAPEQLEGARGVDHRADIYSLGVTFYEMLTGELPIGRFAAPSKMVQIDVRLDEVVLRSLEKAPEQRYQHASEIKTEMDAIARGPAAEAAGASTSELKTPISVPYEVTTSAFWGAGAYGILRFDGASLEFEFKKRFWEFDSSLRTVKIPLSEVKSLWVEKGNFSSSLCLRTHRLRALNDLPGSSQAQVILDLDPKHEAAGQEMQRVVSRALQPYPQASEIKMELDATTQASAATARPYSTPPNDSPARTGYLRAVVLPLAVLSFLWIVALLAITGVGRLLPENAHRFLHQDVGTVLLIGGWIVLPAVALILNGVWLYRLYRVAAAGGYLRTVAVPLAVWCAVLIVVACVLMVTLRPTEDQYFVLGDPRQLAAFGAILAGVGLLVLSCVWLYRTMPVGSYLRTVVAPFFLLSFAFACAVGVAALAGFELRGPDDVRALALVWAFGAAVALNAIWLYRTMPVAGYFRTVVFPFFALSTIWLLLIGIFLAGGRFLNGWPLDDFTEGLAFGYALTGMALAGFALHAVWLCRLCGVTRAGLMTHAARHGSSVVRRFLAVVWTVACIVLFVLFWTPCEKGTSRYREKWSGCLDAWVWPYRGTSACAVSLEPSVPTCRRLVIREKAETSRSGYEGIDPDQHVTTLTYDIELEPLSGEPLHALVDALNGMNCIFRSHKALHIPKAAGEREGTFLDAPTLTDWLASCDTGLAKLEPKIEEQKKEHQDRLAAHAVQARTVVDILRRAAKLHTDGTRDLTMRGQTFHIEMRDDKWINRLRAATDLTLLDGNATFLRNPGWNATESVKWQPAVPILYVGVPLMLVVWGVGLWLLLRRRGEASRAP